MSKQNKMAVSIDIVGAITTAYSTYATAVTTYLAKQTSVTADLAAIAAITFGAVSTTNASYNTPANALEAANTTLNDDRASLVTLALDMRAKELLVIAAMKTNSGVTGGSNQWMKMSALSVWIGYAPQQIATQEVLVVKTTLPIYNFPNF